MNSKRDHSNQVIRVLSDSRGEYAEVYNPNSIYSDSFFVDLEDLDRVLSSSSWSRDKYGYFVGKIKGKQVKLHRFILEYNGDKTIDHVDGVKGNCRKYNLEVVDRAVNRRRAKFSGKSSKFKGVSYDNRSKRWMVYCQIDGKNYYISCFILEQVGAIWYDAFMIQNGKLEFTNLRKNLYDSHDMEILGVSSYKELEKLIRSKSLKTL